MEENFLKNNNIWNWFYSNCKDFITCMLDRAWIRWIIKFKTKLNYLLVLSFVICLIQSISHNLLYWLLDNLLRLNHWHWTDGQSWWQTIRKYKYFILSCTKLWQVFQHFSRSIQLSWSKSKSSSPKKIYQRKVVNPNVPKS